MSTGTAPAASASARFDGLEPAPSVLLTQELVNTKRPGEAPFADLLDTAASAQEWLDGLLLLAWSRRHGTPPPALVVAEADLAALRELRSAAEAALAGDGAGRALRGVVRLTAGAEGAVDADALDASAAGWFEAQLLLERLRAEVEGTWSRLKLCANPDCRVAFSDRSRNRSAVWHSVERCGNKLNLRRLRARRGAEGDGPA